MLESYKGFKVRTIPKKNFTLRNSKLKGVLLQALVHSPYDFPMVNGKGFLVGESTEAYVGIEASVIESTDGVKEMAFARRGCAFVTETDLPEFLSKKLYLLKIAICIKKFAFIIALRDCLINRSLANVFTPCAQRQMWKPLETTGEMDVNWSVKPRQFSKSAAVCRIISQTLPAFGVKTPIAMKTD